MTKPWNTNGVEGAHRFLNRIWRLFINDSGELSGKISKTEKNGSDSFKRVWHKTVKKVTEDMEALRFNTAISQLMIFVNEAYKTDVLPYEAMKDFVQMLSPIAPHIAEELWEKLGGESTVSYEPWPSYEEAWTVENEVEIVVQVNGKIVERIKIAQNTDKAEMESIAKGLDKVKQACEGKTIRKVIAVPGKLVNIVAN